MKTSDQNLNEKFLLELLNLASSVYNDINDKLFYFYPKNLGFTVKVPYSQHSNSVDVNFVFSKEDGRETAKDVVNMSFSSHEEVKEFMAEIYKKHEEMLNNGHCPSDVIAKFNEVLSTPLDSSQYQVRGRSDDLKLIEKTPNYDLQINIGTQLFTYNSSNKFTPLSPIVLECFYKASTSTKNEYFKKVIPAYEIEKYPVLAEFAHINHTTKDIHSLTDALEKINPESAAILGSIILDIELDKKDIPKINKPKI